MPGGPVVMMDWLAERGLDRKALGLLQANATAHEAYRVRLHRLMMILKCYCRVGDPWPD